MIFKEFRNQEGNQWAASKFYSQKVSLLFHFPSLSIPFEKYDAFQQRIFLVAYCSSSWDFEPKKQYLQNMGKSLHTREFEILKVLEHSTSRTGDI